MIWIDRRSLGARVGSGDGSKDERERGEREEGTP
jgi:hypothetical protein